MIAVIGRPVELVMAVSLVNGVLGLIPRGVDKSERLAHEPVPSLPAFNQARGRQATIHTSSREWLEHRSATPSARPQTRMLVHKRGE